uniref:DYW domain-containing protein n=1 Tax=Lactuca sativa TaxID=4236 RepID=A0A9R1VAV3_LACSA|nr:hypothetical protein LSAT_V11C600317570 [Lactuca sativa]
MYARCGQLGYAHRLFDEMPKRNLVSWTAMISVFSQNSEFAKAITTFCGMYVSDESPNQFAFSSVIQACSSLKSVQIDMYSKCGSIIEACMVFEEMPSKDEVSWNSMINGYAKNGYNEEALVSFKKMLTEDVTIDQHLLCSILCACGPLKTYNIGRSLHSFVTNSVTFINLLNACSHSGLLTEGLSYFNSMETIYGVKPKSEHYSCVIDLLGRSGKLKEAENFIKSMPFEANAYAWCSFLASCRKYGDKERGELASKSLKIIDPLNSGAHVLLSNIYAKEQQWEDVKSVRKMMKDENVKKLKGCSWVDVDKRVHVFGVEDLCHGDKKEIDLKLDELLRKIIKVGYVPDVDFVPFDLDYYIVAPGS